MLICFLACNNALHFILSKAVDNSKISSIINTIAYKVYYSLCILLISTLRSIGSLVGEGMHTFLGDQQRVQMAVGGLVALTAGYFTAKGALAISFRFLEARLGETCVLNGSRCSWESHFHLRHHCTLATYHTILYVEIFECYL